MHACAVEMAAQQAQGQPLSEAGAQPGAQGTQHGQVCFFMTIISTMYCTLCLQERPQPAHCTKHWLSIRCNPNHVPAAAC